MTARVTLAVCATHVQTELRVNPRSVFGFVRRSPEKTPVVARVPVRPRGLEAALDQAIATLSHESGRQLRDAQMDVQLGFDHSRVSLVNVSQPEALRGSRDVQQKLVFACVREVLHENPKDHVVRWQLSKCAGKLLVTCVDAKVFNLLESWSKKHVLRLVSCKPAVLQATDMRHGTASLRTIAWTECANDGTRNARIQLLKLAREEILASWRGWVPTDEALEGAIRRFEARHECALDERGSLVSWPLVAG